MFYLQDQMTYIPSLEACTGACRSSPAPSPAALPLAHRHTLRVWQPGWIGMGTAGTDTRLKAVHQSCVELAKFKNSKTKIAQP